MKRILSILLALAMTLCAFCLAEAPETVVGNLNDFTVEYIGEAAIAVTGYSGSEPHLMIPPVKEMSTLMSTGMNLEATTLGMESFANNSALQTLYIPEGYDTIQNRAFRGCENLTAVYLPSTLLTIGSEAFADCTSLTTIVFPQGANLINFDETAFDGCTRLQMTQADFDQLLDAGFFEAVAEEEQRLAEFTVDTNAVTEISGYLGTDLKAYGEMMNADEYIDSDNCGYLHDGIRVSSRLTWVYIESIGIRQKCNYSICGVYVSMNADEARSLLAQSGWTIENQRSDSVVCKDASDNILHISIDESGSVSEVSISLGGAPLDILLSGNHDGSSLYSPAVSAPVSGTASGSARASSKVNMRAGAGLNYDVIGSVPANVTIEYLGEEKTDSRGVVWYHVRCDGNEGWCSSKYVDIF